MPGKISDMSGVTFPFTGTEALEVVQSGVNRKVTVAQLAKLIRTDVARRRFSYYNDFINDLSTTANGDMSESNSGTGAGTAVLSQVNANQVGLVQSSTGTTTTGRTTVQSASAMMVAGAGELAFELNGRVTTLSDVVQEFTLRIGFFDNAGTDAADGIYFEYDRLSSVNWRICGASNSTRTKNDSGVVVNTNFNRLTIVVNDAGTSAEFFINGVSVGTVTTNLPNTVGRTFGFGWQLVKSAGTTARTFDVDYIAVELDFTTPRG